MSNLQFKNLKFHYVLGRFKFARLLHSYLKKTFKQENIVFSLKESIFQNSNLNNVNNAVKEIKENSFSACLELDRSFVEKLLNDLSNYNYDTPSNKNLSYEEIFNDKKIAIAYLQNPKKNKYINLVAKDSFIMEIVKKYIGYYPNDYDVKLIYSFAKNIDNESRRLQHQTIDYHFDIHGFNFIYANFYLTDTNTLNGCHALIRGSHNKKLKLEFGKARIKDEKLFKYYDKSKEIFIVGKKGYGFLEDTSCYHKALQPKKGYRAMLQIRYY